MLFTILQNAGGLRRITAENFEIHFIIFWKIFRKILIISKNFKENFEIFWEILCTFSIIFRKTFRIKSFRKTSKIISENFWKLPEIFLKVSTNIAEILRFVLKIWKMFRENSIIIAENFENYFTTFWEIFRKLLTIIAENFENHFKIFEKNFGDFEKYYGHFREVFRKITSRNSTEIFEIYFGKLWELYWKIFKIISKNFKINFGRYREIPRTFLKSISENFENSSGATFKMSLTAIHITISRNDEFLHSFCNLLKSNACGENLIRTKFMLHKIFFRMRILSSRKTSPMFFNLRWKNYKNHLWEDMTILKGSGCLVTTINFNFFVRNEVLNIFHITITKKKTMFPKITAKNNFWRYDHFSGSRVSDDKNEYNLLFRKFVTKYGFEIFSSKTSIRTEWKPENQFWGHIFHHISGSIGLIDSK